MTMMNYNLEIQKILLKADELTNAIDKINLLKQAIVLADANNDADWGYDLRMDLIATEFDTSNSVESFQAFAWLLNACDTEPEMFNEKDLLDTYEWLASVSFLNAGFSKDQIDYILSDFRERSKRCGHSDWSYYELKTDWMLMVGDRQGARDCLAMRDAEMNENPNFGQMTAMCVELINGDFEKGIAQANKILVRKEHPKTDLSVYSQLIYYLNDARDERVKVYIDKSEEVLSDLPKNSNLLFDVTLLMYYFSRNDKEKAWTYFEEYVDWEIGGSDYSMFDFALSILPLLKDGGTRTLKLSPRLPYYNESGVYDASVLYDYYYKRADEYAALFDQRNGTPYFREQMNKHLS